MVKELAQTLIELLEPAAIAHGYELVTVEQTGGRHTPVIRVLLDRDGGVDLEAITTANAWVNETLEEADPIPGPYTLEVSSPGVDRPLRTRSDYERFAGETVTIKARGIAGRSTWTGTLVGIDGDSVVLEVEGEHVAVPLDNIHKARLKGVVDFGGKEGSARDR